MGFLSPLPPITIGDDDYDRLAPLAEAWRAKRPDLAELLQSELTRARIVPHAMRDRRVVALNSQVVFAYDHLRQSHWVTLVLPGGSEIAEGRISIATPAGVALLGLREGDSIGWQSLSGLERRITVHRVVHAPV